MMDPGVARSIRDFPDERWVELPSFFFVALAVLGPFRCQILQKKSFAKPCSENGTSPTSSKKSEALFFTKFSLNFSNRLFTIVRRLMYSSLVSLHLFGKEMRSLGNQASRESSPILDRVYTVRQDSGRRQYRSALQPRCSYGQHRLTRHFLLNQTHSKTLAPVFPLLCHRR